MKIFNIEKNLLLKLNMNLKNLFILITNKNKLRIIKMINNNKT